MNDGDLLGFGVDPMDVDVDRNAFYIYKVCKTIVVECIELSDSDDDGYQSITSNNVPETNQRPGINPEGSNKQTENPENQSIQDDEMKDFDAVDFVENLSQTSQPNEVKPMDTIDLDEEDKNKEKFEQALLQIGEVIDSDIEEQFVLEEEPPTTTEDQPSTSAEAAKAVKSPLSMVQLYRDKAKTLNGLQVASSGYNKPEIIQPHIMLKRRTSTTVFPTSSILNETSESSPKKKKRGRPPKPKSLNKPKNKKIKQDRKEKLKEIVPKNPTPEKKDRDRNNPVKAKLTGMSRSDVLNVDLIKQYS